MKKVPLALPSKNFMGRKRKCFLASSPILGRDRRPRLSVPASTIAPASCVGPLPLRSTILEWPWLVGVAFPACRACWLALKHMHTTFNQISSLSLQCGNAKGVPRGNVLAPFLDTSWGAPRSVAKKKTAQRAMKSRSMSVCRRRQLEMKSRQKQKEKTPVFNRSSKTGIFLYLLN